jgi:hypothetical protein
MKVEAILDHVRDHLVAQVEGLEKGNCVPTATPALMPQLGRRYVQVFYNGSNFIDYGGGNLMRQMRMGLRLYNQLAMDVIGRFEEQSRDMLQFLRVIIKVLHMHYDVNTVTLQEPLTLTSESPMRRVDPEGAVWYVEQDWSLGFVSTFTEVRA